MRLIDADELNKFPIRLDHYDKKHGDEVFVLGIESVLEYAEYLPTVDAVTVTRCRDCVHWQKFNDDMRRDGMCEALLNFHGAERNMTNEDFFCAHGERRSDEQQIQTQAEIILHAQGRIRCHDDLRLGMDGVFPPVAGGREQAVGGGGEHTGERSLRESQHLDGSGRNKGGIWMGDINRPAGNKNAAQRV